MRFHTILFGCFLALIIVLTLPDISAASPASYFDDAKEYVIRTASTKYHGNPMGQNGSYPLCNLRPVLLMPKVLKTYRRPGNVTEGDEIFRIPLTDYPPICPLVVPPNPGDLELVMKLTNGAAFEDYSEADLENILDAAQKRGCVRRGGNCDHRPGDCCNNSTCRCNLWGANCRCQRKGLFQKWGK